MIVILDNQNRKQPVKKIKLMNSDVEIIPLRQKMCLESEDYFNDNFHSGIDIYLNALDNVDARIYMDSMSLRYSKPLIDSGTMGSKGSVQVILPHLTESYGSSKDPDEKAGIPICTIKAFPYKPEHTIQWARELFESEFNLIPSIINKFNSNPNKLEKINDADAKQFLRQLYKYNNFELTIENFNKILGTIWRENFYDNIQEIIVKYSKEETMEELGDKKLPEHLSFEYDNYVGMIEFYTWGYKLLNQMFNSDVKFIMTENNDGTKLLSEAFGFELDNMSSEQIIQIIIPIINLVPRTYPVEFEKDDDELGHVQWISLCSNMRNHQYSIPQTDLWEVRKIAGNIIPALITTTSLISGYQILEFIRVCKLYRPDRYIVKEHHKDIDMYKNRFVNLNTNYCDGINPSSSFDYKLDNGNNISIWTNFKTSHINTDQIINQIESETKKKIEFMTQGNKTVYDGDDINIDKIDPENKSNILVLLEDVPIGIPLLYYKK